MILNSRSINIYRRLSLRYIDRNKSQLIEKTIDIINENGTNELLSYLKYNNITNDSINSYIYIIIYELFYLSILLKIKTPNEHKEIINKSVIHVLLYFILKQCIFPYFTYILS